MLRCFHKSETVYTSDCHEIRGMEQKLYRSILSFPVLDQGKKAIAVVNVDGTEPNLFDKKKGDQPDTALMLLAQELSQPAISIIALALEHCSPFDGEL